MYVRVELLYTTATTCSCVAAYVTVVKGYVVCLRITAGKQMSVLLVLHLCTCVLPPKKWKKIIINIMDRTTAAVHLWSDIHIYPIIRRRENKKQIAAPYCTAPQPRRRSNHRHERAPGHDKENQATNALSGSLCGEGEVALPLKSALMAVSWLNKKLLPIHMHTIHTLLACGCVCHQRKKSGQLSES